MQYAKPNSIQNKLSKAYQTKLNRDKNEKFFLPKILKNIQIHNQMKMCIGTIVKLLESQIVFEVNVVPQTSKSTGEVLEINSC